MNWSGAEMSPDPITVLFVTSDPVLAAVYRQKLESDEYRLSWAEPRSALDLIRSAPPDLIYLDLDSIGGSKVLRTIRASDDLRSRPLIVITRRPEEVETVGPGLSEPFHLIALARPVGSAVSG